MLVYTQPGFNEGGCTSAGGTLAPGPALPDGTPTMNCDLSPVLKRPSWLVFGLSVAGALAVGAGAMHLAMKGNHR